MKGHTEREAKMHRELLWESLLVKDHLEHRERDERIILR
jgi:hypothetical protein